MSEEEKKGDSINFGLESFKILKYKIEDPGQGIDLENLGYQVRFRPEPNIDKRTFSIEFEVAGQIGKKEPLVLGSIKTITTYSLSNMDELINEDGHFILPKGLAVTLLSIALSTTRGALVAKSEGNILSKASYPWLILKRCMKLRP